MPLTAHEQLVIAGAIAAALGLGCLLGMALRDMIDGGDE